MPLRRPLFALTTLVAALFSAATLASAPSTRNSGGHDASVRVDRLAQHAAPWQVGVAPVSATRLAVQERQQHSGNTGAVDVAIWTATFTTHARTVRHALRTAAPFTPRTARHRVGFDATAPPRSTHRIA